MTRQARFWWWLAAVVVALASPMWVVFGGLERAWLMAATAQSLVSLTGMVWLLRTTPGDAVRLPRLLSVAVVFAGFVWLGTFSGMAQTRLSIVDILILVMLLMAANRRSSSSTVWALAIVLWHPVVAMLRQMILNEPRASVVCVVVSLVGVLIAAHFTERARFGRALWAAWTVSVVATMALSLICRLEPAVPLP